MLIYSDQGLQFTGIGGGFVSQGLLSGSLDELTPQLALIMNLFDAEA